MKNILLIGTLDTKGDELFFIKDLVEKAHHRPIIMDTGVGESKFKPDITTEEILRHSGKNMEELTALQDGGKIIQFMSPAVEAMVQKLYDEGQIDGAVAIGGAQGSAIASAGLKTLPVGFPKALVSTKAVQAGIKGFTGSKDVAIIPSVCDIAGLNRITRKILANAVGAVIGMVNIDLPPYPDRPAVVLTMNGTVNNCCLRVKQLLEKDGYEVIVFHTIGGGKALEKWIDDISPDIACVIELSLEEIGNELFGGMASAGKERLEAAGRLGIPQIVTLGAVDFINFLAWDTVPEKYRNRNLHWHTPQATTMRMEKEEMEIIARTIAEKLNKAKGKVEVMIPLGGFSAWD
ncbi:MAG: Tm-1-like ATP-binding domain-containing protein, partial [Desulfatiglandales bacterium]